MLLILPLVVSFQREVFCLFTNLPKNMELSMDIAPYKKFRSQNTSGNLLVDESCIDVPVLL